MYGAYKLRIYGIDLYFFVMNNLLLTLDNEPLNEKYDLKGSWVARNAAPPQPGQSATCSFCNQKFVYHRKSKKSKKAKVQQNSIESASGRTTVSLTASNSPLDKDKKAIEFEDICPMTVHGYHEPNVIMKDNDLKYKVRLPNSVGLTLYTQLRQDAHFLSSMGIMDYSLLVGVHNHEYEVEVADNAEALLEASKAPSSPLQRSNTMLKRRASTLVKSSPNDTLDLVVILGNLLVAMK